MKNRIDTGLLMLVKTQLEWSTHSSWRVEEERHVTDFSRLTPGNVIGLVIEAVAAQLDTLGMVSVHGKWFTGCRVGKEGGS